LQGPIYFLYLPFMRRLAAYIIILSALVVWHEGVNGQTAERTIKQYRFTSDYSATVEVPFDTSFVLFHRQRSADRYSPFNAYPGNYGLPLYQINFFHRERNPDYYLYQNYYPFMYVPEKALFMDTPVPFSELLFTYAGPTRNTAEQNFRFRQSLNLNSRFNLGIIYDIIYNLGNYSYQKAEDKNFLLHGSYINKRYEVYGALGINNLYSNENGGITDPAVLDQYGTRDVPVLLGGLNNAKSTLKNQNFMLIQKYYPVKTDQTGDSVARAALSGSFTHIFSAEGNKRTYYDTRPRSGFYDTAYISDSRTLDSLSSFLLKNTVRFDFRFKSKGGFMLGAGGGIRHEFHRYGQIVPGDTLNGQDTIGFGHQNIALTGRIENRIGNSFGWQATGDLYAGGYRAGDFNIAGEIVKDFKMKKGNPELAITGTVSLTKPSVWFTRWGSNNFKWDFDAAREFMVGAGASFRYPGRKLTASFDYSITDNFTYFGSDAMPSQHSGALSVAAVTVDKIFTAGWVNFGNTVLLQQSSNSNILSLPLATLKSALWFYKDIRFAVTGGRLEIETGAELFMHTPYKAYSYMPSTGRFYNQSGSETGNYPFVNVFLNAKIKRTRIMLSFDHINHGLTGFDYYLLPRYPMNVRMFRYGLAWTFYD
jgi:hypothetical protein